MKFKFLSPLPCTNTNGGKPSNGSVVDLTSYCSSVYGERCRNFYSKCPEGLSTCPFGFSVYRFKVGKEDVIWSGIKIRDNYIHEEMTKRPSTRSLPIFETKQIRNFERKSRENYNIAISRFHSSIDEHVKKAKEKLKKNLDLTTHIFHEVRPLNGDIKAAARKVMSRMASLKHKLNSNDRQFDELKKDLNGVINATNLISTRLNLRDFLINPDFSPNEKPVKKNIEKLASKVVQLVELKIKKKEIAFSNNLSNGISVDILDSFALLLFVILENAAKYSPPGQDVSIYDLSKGKFKKIIIESFGPKIHSKDGQRIFEDGFRSELAIELEKEGSGIGLFLAKKVAARHNFKLSFSQEERSSFNLNDTNYHRTEFRISIPVSMVY